MASGRELLTLLICVALVALWSASSPHDGMIWWMESIPVWIGAAVLIATRSRFPLTRLTYYLIALHAIILLVGAHYTYGRVPLGLWMRDLFDFSRNHYDRIGHFAQGFVPAMIARELFIRLNVINRPGWRFFLVLCFCLAFSAFYELVEWWSVVIGGDSTLEFLGVQGDVWDAQWDMTFAAIGAIASQLLLGGYQDRQLERLRFSTNAEK